MSTVLKSSVLCTLVLFLYLLCSKTVFMSSWSQFLCPHVLCSQTLCPLPSCRMPSCPVLMSCPHVFHSCLLSLFPLLFSQFLFFFCPCFFFLRHRILCLFSLFCVGPCLLLCILTSFLLVSVVGGAKTQQQEVGTYE